MIFKGYTIVYEIDTTNNQIIVLNIFDKNKPPFSQEQESSAKNWTET